METRRATLRFWTRAPTFFVNSQSPNTTFWNRSLILDKLFYIYTAYFCFLIGCVFVFIGFSLTGDKTCLLTPEYNCSLLPLLKVRKVVKYIFWWSDYYLRLFLISSSNLFNQGSNSVDMSFYAIFSSKLFSFLTSKWLKWLSIEANSRVYERLDG